ncbi:tetratricopeptide repeat protein [Streptomyces sp. NPDC057199]|uniref:tetratricopeptide repeat protein n=1 Tax=Streptomyces sp. NPDC057199 TaxID=3346047 RepID=UPI0036344484
MSRSGAEPHVAQGSHQVVHAESGYGYGVVGADLHVFGDGVPLYLLENWSAASPPDPEWLRELPSRMLNARHRVVEFTGRADELAALHEWRQTGPRLAARWLHGPGGQGKSRLAAQFATECVDAGWKVVNVVHGPGTLLPEPGSHDLRLRHETGLLLIVDYADRWPLSHLTWLFSNALLRRSGLPTRILLLARTASVWPAVRATLDSHHAGTSGQFLDPLPPGDQGARTQMFRTARDSFVARYGLSVPPDIRPPDTLDHADFGLTLAVHMAALVAVDAHVTGRRAPTGTAGLTVYLLDREHLHWARLYGDGTHELDPEGRSFHTPPDVMNRTVFTAALTGPLSRPSGTAVLTALRDAGATGPPPDQVLVDHATCYPPGQLPEGTVLEPLYPDRLAEDFLALTLPGHAYDYPAQPWAAPTTAGALVRDNDRAPAAWTPRAVTFLASAAARWPHVGPGHLYGLLRADPALAVSAGSAALTALAGLDSLDPALMEAVAAHFPDGRSTDLDPGIAALALRLAPHRLADAEGPSQRATIHDQLAGRLHLAGRQAEALAETRQATAILRELAAEDAATHEPMLAETFAYQGTLLSEEGRHREALPLLLEALTIWQRVMKREPRHLPGLARSMTAAAVVVRNLRGHRDSLPLAEKSVGTWRKLFAHEPEEWGPDLANALVLFCIALDEAGRSAEALPVAEEAVAVLRRLASSDPAVHELELSQALSAWSAVLGHVGRYKEAMAAAEETVEIRRRLAVGNPDLYEPLVASALNGLAVAQAEAGRWSEALAAAREAVEVQRRLAAGNPDAYEFQLALALCELGLSSAKAGRSTEAVAAVREGVTIWRRLAADNPTIGEPELAAALHNLAVVLSDARRHQEALAAAEEAVIIRRRLAAVEPVAEESGFALALDQFGRLLSAVGRQQEAVTISVEAVSIWRRLAADGPTAHESRLATSLHNLAKCLSDRGEHAMAVPLVEESVAIYRRLSASEPAVYEPDLAEAVFNLTTVLGATGRTAEALTAVGETADIYLRLSETEPAAYEGDLAAALGRLGSLLSEAGWPAEALTVTEDAALLYGQLTEADPARHEAHFAYVLADLSHLLIDAGRNTDALLAAENAAPIYRRLARSDPAAHEPSCATLLANLGALFQAAGRNSEAVAVTQESITIRRRLTADDPADFEEYLAASLHNLGAVLAGVARWTEARAATNEAVTIYRKLARADPAAHEARHRGSIAQLDLIKTKSGLR